jgi:hypothetical protein
MHVSIGVHVYQNLTLVNVLTRAKRIYICSIKGLIVESPFVINTNEDLKTPSHKENIHNQSQAFKVKLPSISAHA